MMKTTVKQTPITQGMKIWADRFGFNPNKTAVEVTAVRAVKGGVMITIEGVDDEINIRTNTPYLIAA